jgi:hypothetical protein
VQYLSGRYVEKEQLSQIGTLIIDPVHACTCSHQAERWVIDEPLLDQRVFGLFFALSDAQTRHLGYFYAHQTFPGAQAPCSRTGNHGRPLAVE